jgi:pyruvate/2-oxoglutarate dehydrogenase complex dihydrolipoamide acyltransferase (E2) component
MKGNGSTCAGPWPAVTFAGGVTLSCDHRILYGAQAAEFLSAIREPLEQPLRLAL